MGTKLRQTRETPIRQAGKKQKELVSVGEVMKRRRDQERIIQERIFRRGL
jgi:hypothetical protein